MREINIPNNSDLVENLSALECLKSAWKIYRYDYKEMNLLVAHSEEEEMNKKNYSVKCSKSLTY